MRNIVRDLAPVTIAYEVFGIVSLWDSAIFAGTAVSGHG